MNDSTHRFERDRLFKKWGQFKYLQPQLGFTGVHFGFGAGAFIMHLKIFLQSFSKIIRVLK